jgi:replicative DNA helicase
LNAPHELPLPLPCDTEAEQSLIACALRDSATALAAAAAAGIEARHFHVDGHDRIWSTIVAMSEAGEPIDAFKVLDRLEAAGVTERCGGHEYVTRLSGGVLNTAGVARYAAAVREKALHRDLICGLEASTAIALRPDGAAKAAEVAEQTIARVRAASAPPAQLFKIVDLSRLGEIAPAQQEWFWQGLVPQGTSATWAATAGPGNRRWG